jgi:hypothetical protein
MPATIIRLADAVVEQLNTATLSYPVEAKRYYQPLFELPEMETLHVSVAPTGLTSTRVSRSSHTHDYQIDVAVQKKFTDGDAPELDPLMQLVEEIAALFRTQPLASFTEAVCLKVENVPVYAPEHMENLRQFTSVLTLTYRVAE